MQAGAVPQRVQGQEAPICLQRLSKLSTCVCTVQGCLGMAFLVEGLLFAFHLEGSELNWKAHLLLVMSIFAAVGAILGEIAAPGNVLLGLARTQLVMLQGLWFMQIAKLLFEGVHHCLIGVLGADLNRWPTACYVRTDSLLSSGVS